MHKGKCISDGIGFLFSVLSLKDLKLYFNASELHSSYNVIQVDLRFQVSLHYAFLSYFSIKVWDCLACYRNEPGFIFYYVLHLYTYLVSCIFYSSYEFNCSQEKFKGLKGPNITNSDTYCQLELPQHFLSTENKTEQITILLLLIIYDNYSKYIKSHQHYFDVTRRKRHILFSIDLPISPLLFFDCFK